MSELAIIPATSMLIATPAELPVDRPESTENICADTTTATFPVDTGLKSSTISLPDSSVTSCPENPIEITNESKSKEEQVTPTIIIGSQSITRVTPGSAPASAPVEKVSSFYWSHTATEALVEAWVAYQAKEIRCLTLDQWNHIKSIVNERNPGGYKSLVQCRRKIDKMKREYKRLYELKSKPGGESFTWQFYDQFDGILNGTTGRSGRGVSRGFDAALTYREHPFTEYSAFHGEQIEDDLRFRESIPMGDANALPSISKQREPKLGTKRNLTLLMDRESDGRRAKKKVLQIEGPDHRLSQVMIGSTNTMLAVEKMRTEVLTTLEKHKQEILSTIESKFMQLQEELQLKYGDSSIGKEVTTKMEERRLEIESQMELKVEYKDVNELESGHECKSGDATVKEAVSQRSDPE